MPKTGGPAVDQKVDKRAAVTFRLSKVHNAPQQQKRERVLTAQEASVINGLASASLRTPSTGITDAQLQRVTAGAVNAMLTGQTTQNINIKVPLNINGREFARATIDDIRAVSRSTPEVASDF